MKRKAFCVYAATPHWTLSPDFRNTSSMMTTKTLIERYNLNKLSSRLLRKRTQLAIDFTILSSALLLAYFMRFDFNVPSQEVKPVLFQLPLTLILQGSLLLLSGVYSFIWRYTGMAELRAFWKVAACSFLVLLLLRLGLPPGLQVLRMPVSIIIIDTVFAFGGMVAVRVLRRFLYEKGARQQRGESPRSGDMRRVLLVGAGQAGMLAAREIRNCAEMDCHIEGFVDDAPEKQRSVIQGVKVLGTTNDIPRIVSELNIDHVVISIAQATRADFRRILDICEPTSAKVRTVPGLSEILRGNVKVTRIRDIQLEDLLGRDPVQLDEESMKELLNDGVVMVTGAGGSIGSELARQVARFNPSRLLLVERAEFALFSIDSELRAAWPALSIISLVGDVGDERRMRHIFETHRPRVVFHAAAHKHVPMMEHNTAEAVKNNIFGTHLVGKMAGEFGVAAFVLISTDKAVNPTSVMGASKRMAELVVQDFSVKYPTRFITVRFGNVIGSTGSVIPIFAEQIRRGGPVTVTHPDMVRYFMTIPEAAQLVLQAGAMGKGGEIFVLDMGEPVRILDLAKDAIALSGLKPFVDVDIVFTGIRPGEKLVEELQTEGENIAKTSHAKIFIGNINPASPETIRFALDRLRALVDAGKDQELRRTMNSFLKEAQLVVEEEDTTDRKANERAIVSFAAATTSSANGKAATVR
jgi:FlaA1/EpsC-like NDP-sugar epimerase